MHAENTSPSQKRLATVHGGLGVRGLRDGLPKFRPPPHFLSLLLLLLLPHVSKQLSPLHSPLLQVSPQSLCSV